jgi:Mg-chelatase subunit ChlD
MSALFTALDDKMWSIQLGEKKNLEYTWSSNIEELITQLYFQLTRSSDITILKDKYQELLIKIFSEQNTTYIKLLYKLIGHTRDIVAGKGEYNLTYMLISELYNFSLLDHCSINDKYKIQNMATCAIESLIRTEINEHPYGSWKDLKYFCNYHIPKEYRFEHKLKELNDPLFNKVIDIICGQLQCDQHAPVKTLLAKWIPREKSEKFGWIVPILATRFYSEWYKDETLTYTQKTAARRKCLTHFRQLVAGINKQLNTPQINQCDGTWKNINFDKNVTSITLRKQSKAFQGVDKRGNIREKVKNNEDRMECTKHYTQFVQNCKSGKSVAKGKRVSVIDFVRDALNEVSNTTEKDMINAQWEDNGKQNGLLENYIAMVDTSASMECDNNVPLYSALGLGMRIAEKSKLGKRVLTFTSSPTWVNLEDCPDFVSMIQKVREAPWGSNTNFRAALDLILDTAIENNISPDDMKKMVLVILSDMQIDCANSDYAGISNDTMFNMMREKYRDAGLRTIYKQPYELPHIIFWNLRPVTGFPSLSTEKNTSMMSGNSPVLLNSFCDKGIDALTEMTPWTSLVEQLSNDRYNHLEKIVENLWTKSLD